MRSKQHKTCLEYALALIAKRSYACLELVQKLKLKKYEEEDIKQAIERLFEMDYLDDEKYAKGRIKYRAEVSGWGKLRIQKELQQKGIDEAVVKKQLIDFEQGNSGALFSKNKTHSWQEQANDMLLRKFGKWPSKFNEDVPSAFEEKEQFFKEREKEKNKRMRFLIAKGFSMEEALEAFSVSREQ